jgi:hypothetical protein
MAVCSQSDRTTAADTLESLPRRIRDIATLRGLGYTFREIGREFEVSPQAVSLMLMRHRRVLKRLRGAIELQGLSPRAVNALGRFGIRTRQDAAGRNVLDLLKSERNCGAKTRSEIERWLDGNGTHAQRAEENIVPIAHEASEQPEFHAPSAGTCTDSMNGEYLARKPDL